MITKRTIILSALLLICVAATVQDGLLTVRRFTPRPGIGTNYFQIENTNSNPLVYVGTNDALTVSNFTALGVFTANDSVLSNALSAAIIAATNSASVTNWITTRHPASQYLSNVVTAANGTGMFTNNGSGVLGWMAISGGSGDAGGTNSRIANTSGIGTNLTIWNGFTSKSQIGGTVRALDVFDTNGNSAFHFSSNLTAVIRLGTNSTGYLTASNNASVTNTSFQSGENAPSIYLGPGGNVGVRQSAPSAYLEITGTPGATGTMLFTAGTNNTTGLSVATNGVASAGGSTIATSGGATTSGRISIWNGITTSGQPSINGAGNLTSDFSGNMKANSAGVGIPGAILSTLHLTNNVASSDLLRAYTQTGNGSLFAFGVSSNRLALFGASGATNTPPAGYAGMFAETNAGTIELAVIDSAGNVTQISPHPRDCPPIFLVVTNWMSGWPEVSKTVKLFNGTVTWKNNSLDTLAQRWNLENTLIGSNFPASLPLIVKTNLARALCVEETFAQYNARRGLTPGSPGFLVRNDWTVVQNQRQSDYNLGRTNELIAFNTPLVFTNDIGQVISNQFNTNIVVRPNINVRETAPELIDHIKP